MLFEDSRNHWVFSRDSVLCRHCVHHTQKHKPWKFQIILLVFTRQLSGNAQTPRYFLFLCLKLEDKNILAVICSKQKFQYDFFSHWCLAISLYMLLYSLLGSQVNIICLCGKHYSAYCTILTHFSSGICTICKNKSLSPPLRIPIKHSTIWSPPPLLSSFLQMH